MVLKNEEEGKLRDRNETDCSVCYPEHGPEERWGIEGIEETGINPEKSKGIVAGLGDLLDIIYLHCFVKEEEARKTKVMALMENNESVGSVAELWKNNRGSHFNFQPRRITQDI